MPSQRSNKRTPSDQRTRRIVSKAMSQIKSQLGKPALKHRKLEHQTRSLRNIGRSMFNQLTGRQQEIYLRKEFYEAVDKTKYWSMAGYIFLFIIISILTIVNFVWYSNAMKQKDNKKKTNQYLRGAIGSFIVSMVLLFYIIHLENLWGLSR